DEPRSWSALPLRIRPELLTAHHDLDLVEGSEEGRRSGGSSPIQHPHLAPSLPYRPRQVRLVAARHCDLCRPSKPVYHPSIYPPVGTRPGRQTCPRDGPDP